MEKWAKRWCNRQMLNVYPNPNSWRTFTGYSQILSWRKCGEIGLWDKICECPGERLNTSLVPRPHPAFCCLQYNFIHVWCNKMEKFCRTNRLHFAYFQATTHSMLSVVSFLVPWLFPLFWAQCTHTQLNPFYPDITHMKKKLPGPPLPLFNCKQRKSWVWPGNEVS